MNILTHCETNVFFKYFLKKTIFMPPTQFEWCSVYKGCDKRTRKNINKAIDLLNKYHFFAYCSVEPINLFGNFAMLLSLYTFQQTVKSGGKIAVKYFINGYSILLCVISPKKFLRSV